MSDEIARSLKLNRNLANNLEKAIQLDRAIKIGWGPQGDPKPKEGEVGIAPHLPEGARVRLLGNLGDFTALACRGGIFTIEGNALGWFGAFADGGRMVVERDAGIRCGHGMTDGRIFVQGDVGDAAGAAMSGGTLVVRGNAGPHLGLGMADGLILIVGDCKAGAGQGMTGGRIIIDGRCGPHGEGATQRTITSAEHKAVSATLAEHDLSISKDAVVLEADADGNFFAEPPAETVWGDFSEIGLVSGEIPLDPNAPLDAVHLLTRGEEDEGVVFPLPVLPTLESGKGLSGRFLSAQPCLVDADPRPVDLVRIGTHNLCEAAETLRGAAGLVLDLDALPPLHDGEVAALMTALRTHLGEGEPVLLAGRVDRVGNLHRMAQSQPLDGVLIRLTTGVGMAAAAALPRIGLSARDANAGDLLHVLELPWEAAADDALISAAAGCGMIAADPFPMDGAPGTQKARAEALEAWLSDFAAELRGRLVDLGIEELGQLNRRHLRALEHDTAAQSGLRLAGYDRPLPHWLGH